MQTSKANRGIGFEQLIEAANRYYLAIGIAAIIKVPTAFKIQRRYDARTKRSEIVGCFPEKKSTVDFMGQFYNIPVSFEAKSTANKTSFPLKNIADHQRSWLATVEQLRGKAFILIECKAINKIYRITFDELRRFEYIGSRKSIPFEYLEKYCHEVTFNSCAIIDYLKDL